MDTHRCPGGCGRQIRNEMLACAYHWRLVPKPLQGEVYAAYRAKVRNPSDDAAVMRHMKAINAAIDAMNGAAA